MWAIQSNLPSSESSDARSGLQNARRPVNYDVLSDRMLLEMNPGDALRTLFLGDLSYFCTEDHLMNLFAAYGPIHTLRVRRGVTGESLMHGFVALESADAARRAIVDLDGVLFLGRNLRVQLSSEGQRSALNRDGVVQLHVSFISKQLHVLVTEAVLREIFAPFGVLVDVCVRRHNVVQKQHRQSGYGFVYFLSLSAAQSAMQTLKQQTVRDITLDCSVSHRSSLAPPAPPAPPPALPLMHTPPNHHLLNPVSAQVSRPMRTQNLGGGPQVRHAPPPSTQNSRFVHPSQTMHSSGMLPPSGTSPSFWESESPWSWSAPSDPGSGDLGNLGAQLGGLGGWPASSPSRTQASQSSQTAALFDVSFVPRAPGPSAPQPSPGSGLWAQMPQNPSFPDPPRL